MKGRSESTPSETARIRELLALRLRLPDYEQKSVRDQLREIGFYISDWEIGLTPEGLDRLISNGCITIIDSAGAISHAARRRPRQGRRAGSDEAYIIDLCDSVLGETAWRQHQFPWLLGDPGEEGRCASLPVDAYYPSRRLVIEYRERQHTEAVDHFDKPNRLTVSGVPRREQRARYDQLRRELIPQHGIELVELSYFDFAQTPQKRLRRDAAADTAVLRQRLSRYLRR